MSNPAITRNTRLVTLRLPHPVADAALAAAHDSGQTLTAIVVAALARQLAVPPTMPGTAS